MRRNKIKFSSLRVSLITLIQILIFTGPTNASFSILSRNLPKFSTFSLQKRFLSSSSAEKTTQEKVNKKTVRILSIDGGGIRGIVPLTILSHIEDKTQKPIAQLFDVISGTSTGGIIALALNRLNSNKNQLDLENSKAANIRDLYSERNGEIFYQHSVLKKLRLLSYVNNFFGSKYSSEKLEELLRDEFKTQLLSEAISTVIIPAYDIRNSKIHVFSSYNKNNHHEDFYMKDVARAISAAPTYFPPAKIYSADHDKAFPNEYKYTNSKHYLIDGGVAANNPTLMAYYHAREFFPEANDFLIVSLGTGTRTIGFTRYNELKDSSFWEWISSGSIKGSGFYGWARKLPGLMINASSSANEYYFDVFLNEFKTNPSYKHRYFRFQPELSEKLTSLDSTHKEIISDLIDHGNKMVTHNPWKSMFDSIIDELKTERDYADKRLKILIPGVHLSKKSAEMMMDSEDIQRKIREDIFADYKTSRTYYTKDQAEKILKKVKKALDDDEV